MTTTSARQGWIRRLVPYLKDSRRDLLAASVAALAGTALQAAALTIDPALGVDLGGDGLLTRPGMTAHRVCG